MPTEHTVQPGECIDSIAFQHGFFPETLWNHGDNAALKQKRKDPNVLAAGDKVIIPDKQLKEESRPQEKRHKFKRKGVPARLRMQVLKPKEPPPPKEDNAGGDDNDSVFEDAEETDAKQEFEPIKNAPYVLDVDGHLTEGETDGDGKVELTIPPSAAAATLRIHPGTPEERVYPLELGGMDPVDTVAGAVKRLNNLGYRCPPDAKELNDEIRDVLKRFQHDTGIQTSGELDQATQDKLKEKHGC